MSPDFWRGKRVFLTGHTGFKGGWLSIWLQSMGAQLTGYALPPSTNPNFFEELDVAKGMTSIIGDIRDLVSLTKSIQQATPEIIFHLAAQPLVRYSYENPIETYSTNVMGTVNLLEAVRNTPGVKSVVVVTTDKCYDNREWVWPYRENDAMGGHDPYSSSKGCAELVTAAYRSSFFNASAINAHSAAIATARAGNVIGGGDWSLDRLVPDILAAINLNSGINIRNPKAIRPWQHVLEPLSGYLMLAEVLYHRRMEFTGAWNFGPEIRDCITVGELAKKLIDMSGREIELVFDAQHKYPHEAFTLRLDISKARCHLNWTPKWGVSDALEKTISWENARLSGKDLTEETINQIKLYSET